MDLIKSEVAKKFLQDAFLAVGVPNDESAVMAESLLDANLCGYDSHGLIRFPTFIKAIEKGFVTPGAELKFIRKTEASAYIDCGSALGPVSARKVFEIASEMARAQGVGCISCCNSNYIARLGGFVEAPARKGFIAILMVNDAGAFPATAPYGSTQAFFSTNPLAAGIPRSDSAPIIIDISTSIAALGKLKILKNQNQQAPEGWLIDELGKTVTDPNSFFANPRKSALLPLGGLLAGHKGYGLSMLIDILAGGLSGMGCSTGKQIEQDKSGFFALVIDPDHFVSRTGLSELTEKLITAIKNTRKMPGVSEILIPGERLVKEREKRHREGISVDENTWAQVTKVLDRLGVTYPQA